MRKSLNDIQQIENYVLGHMTAQEYQDFRVRLLTEAHLQPDVDAQRETYTLIRAYARKKLKAELEAVHQKVFSRSDKAWLRQSIKNLFTRKK